MTAQTSILESVGPIGGVSLTATGAPVLWLVVGDGTIFDRKAKGSLGPSFAPTVILVETENGIGHWMEPSDLSIQQLTLDPSRPMKELVGSPSCSGGFHAMFSNGDVVRLRSAIPAGEFAKLVVVANADTDRFEKIIAPYRLDGSRPLLRGAEIEPE